MNKYSAHVASLFAGVMLMLAAIPGTAADVDVHVVLPGAVFQAQPVFKEVRPVYVQERYESDWRERRVRAIAWRDNPDNHGKAVSAVARKNGKNHKNHSHGRK